MWFLLALFLVACGTSTPTQAPVDMSTPDCAGPTQLSYCPPVDMTTCDGHTCGKDLR